MSYWTEMLGGQVRYVKVGAIETRLLETNSAGGPLISDAARRRRPR